VTESKKLTLLRDRLIRRRREIVEHLQTASLDQDSGDDLARVQNAIDAVVKATPPIEAIEGYGLPN
jgi:hypothetical protein